VSIGSFLSDRYLLQNSSVYAGSLRKRLRTSNMCENLNLQIKRKRSTEPHYPATAVSKHDAAGKGPSYLYTAAGRLWKRTSARIPAIVTEPELRSWRHGVAAEST
jgi:hypothetical protein